MTSILVLYFLESIYFDIYKVPILYHQGYISNKVYWNKLWLFVESDESNRLNLIEIVKCELFTEVLHDSNESRNDSDTRDNNPDEFKN